MSGRGRNKVMRATSWALAGSLAATAVSGLLLLPSYRPDRRALLEDLHLAAALVFVAAALVLFIAAVVARARQRPWLVGWPAALGIFALAQFGAGSGEMVAWDDRFLEDPGAWESYLVTLGITEPGRGVGAAMQTGVREVVAGDQVLSPSGYGAVLMFHVVLAPGAMVLLYALSRRRRARADMAVGGG